MSPIKATPATDPTTDPTIVPVLLVPLGLVSPEMIEVATEADPKITSVARVPVAVLVSKVGVTVYRSTVYDVSVAVRP